LSLIQELLAVQKTRNYGQCQREVAKKLGITVRSVRRLLRRYQQEGIASIVAQPRRDCGRAKIDSDWQNFIVKTYQEGNCGSRRMSPAQVAVRVKVRAQELGTEEYPSHMTVYRILNRLMEQKPREKRSLGWRGDCLILKTREGWEIPIEWSNQVWQCDHTLMDLLVVTTCKQERLGSQTRDFSAQIICK
jgi:putative transposase